MEQTVKHFQNIVQKLGLGLDARVRYFRGGFFCNVKGMYTFRISSEEQFVRKLKYYSSLPEPKPIDLTARLIKIEEAAIRLLEK